MDISAEAVLRSYAHSSRQQMARSRRLDHKGKGAEALMTLLTPLLFSTAAVQQAVQELSPAERKLLDHLILLGGSAPTALLQRLLIKEGLVDADQKVREAWGGYREIKGSPWSVDSRKFADIVARLGVLGLAFTSNPGISGGIDLSQPGYRMYIPDAVLEQLPPVDLPVETTQPPALVRPADPAALLRDNYVLLSEANERPLPLTTAGLIVKRSLAQLNALLRVQEDVAAARSENDLTYLPWLRALAEEQHLLVARAGELRLTEAVPAFLAQPRRERWQQLFAAYRQTPLWCEVFAISGLTVKAAGSRRPAPPLIVTARQRILTEIAALPPERWIKVEHLIDRLRRTAYEFLFPRRWHDSRYSSYGGYAPEPNPYQGQNGPDWVFEQVHTEAQGWDKVEAGFIRVVATQALRWLGIVDLGFHGDRPIAFRVTADGARLLHGEPPAALVPAAPNVVVQPNFQVFAFEPTEESILFRLDQVADRVRVEQASEYRLSRESVYRAHRRGWDAPGVVQFLQEISSVPLPQNVRRSIEEWGAEQERVVIRRGVALLQTVDGATMAALTSDAALAPLVERRVTPTAAVVSPTNLAAVYRLLLERGQMAALSEGPEAQPHPAFSIDARGIIALQEPVPSIFVLHALRPFVDGEPPAPLHITRESLRRGARAGMTAEGILTVLTHYASNPLPPEVTALVQRWAKDWGRGALVGGTLLQVDQAATLRDLLAEPALQRYLTPVPELPTLAIVAPDGLEAVRAALAERGVDTSDRLLG
jgi:hypothetical protein